MNTAHDQLEQIVAGKALDAGLVRCTACGCMYEGPRFPCKGKLGRRKGKLGRQPMLHIGIYLAGCGGCGHAMRWFPETNTHRDLTRAEAAVIEASAGFDEMRAKVDKYLNTERRYFG